MGLLLLEIRLGLTFNHLAIQWSKVSIQSEDTFFSSALCLLLLKTMRRFTELFTGWLYEKIAQEFRAVRF